MEHEALNAVLADVEAGNLDEARQALRPFLLENTEAPTCEVYYLLGRTFFEGDKATARYLFEQALAIKPDFEEAGRYEAKCGSSIEDLEAFDGPRHPRCGHCNLRYRDHEPMCPNCGSSVDPPRDKEDTLESQLKDAGQDVLGSIREFAERDDVKQAREKVASAGKHAYAKARELGESEKAKEIKATFKAIGTVTARKAAELGQRKEVQSAKERAAKLGGEAKEKAREFSEREDVKEAVEKASTTSKNFMKRAQAYVKAEQDRFNAGDGTVRAIIFGKWLVVGLVVLAVLKWLFGGD